MTKRPQRSGSSADAINVQELRKFGHGWILDGQYRQLSPLTAEARRNVLDHFFWWLGREQAVTCGALEIKGFLNYATIGHREPGGRFGAAKLTKPLRPRTVKDIYGILRSFFRYLVAEGYIQESPVEAVRPPIHRPDQIEPFSEEQINAFRRRQTKRRHPNGGWAG